MIVVAQLNKPYTDKARIDFIVEQNHKQGYEIRETETALEALGPDAEEQIEIQKTSVRAVRNSYLETYVDPYQLVIRWNTLSQAEQEDLTNYRQYLLDYTKGENWWEQNPMDFETWKQGNAVIEEME